MSAKRTVQGFSFRQLFFCTLGGLAAAAIVLALFALLIVGRRLPQTVLMPFSTAAICAGCCTGGWLMARTRGENGLLCGAAIAAVFAVLLCIWAWGNGCRSVESEMIIRWLLLLACGCVGGYTGMLRAEKRPGRR